MLLPLMIITVKIYFSFYGGDKLDLYVISYQNLKRWPETKSRYTYTKSTKKQLTLKIVKTEYSKSLRYGWIPFQKHVC